MPVVGFLSSASLAGLAARIAAFRQGLRECRRPERGDRIPLDNQYDRMPSLAADLVRHEVAVIIAGGAGSFSAQAATTTIPVVSSVALTRSSSVLSPASIGQAKTSRRDRPVQRTGGEATRAAP
jgi:hypothetical protein